MVRVLGYLVKSEICPVRSHNDLIDKKLWYFLGAIGNKGEW